MLIHLRFMLNIMLLLISTVSFAAGFNCKKTERLNDAESLICNSKELSDADSRMSKAFFTLKEALPKSEMKILQDDQNEWLKARNEALDICVRVGEESSECRGMYEYAKRIAHLSPLKEVSFDCEKARLPAEKKICSSRLLRHADGVLAKLFQGFKSDFKDSQQEWLQERNETLGEDSCNTRCAWDFLKSRIDFFVHQAF